jgi:KDO2-lipid IV(A) lauroyltransferase
MSKARSRWVDYAVYLVVRLFVCIIQTLTPAAARRLACGLAWLLYRLDRRHREVAHDNLRHAFPDAWTDAQRDDLVRGIYRHFCLLLMEIILLPRKLHITNWKRHVELHGGRQLVDSLLSDRPLLIVSGHYGNWELGGYVMGLLGFTTYAVARPLDNPYLDDFLRQFRQRTGQRVLAKKGDFDQMQQILAGRRVLATLADQDAGQRGLFVDFFGRPASTHKAIALLALEFQVPMLVILARNTGRMLSYDMFIEEKILPEDYLGQTDAVRALTQRFTAALERGIRQAPEQYFWLHRRWKHQPAKPKRRAA